MDELARKVEREIVDIQHLNLSAWQYPPSAIAWAILRHLGQFPRDMQESQYRKISDVAFQQMWHSLKRGAAQAVRWAAQHGASERNWMPENAAVLDAALPLLIWATNYGRLAACFIAYSRKLLSVTGDESSRWIQFSHRAGVPAAQFVAAVADSDSLLNDPDLLPPVALVRGLIGSDSDGKWLATGIWPHDRFCLNGHPAFKATVDWAIRSLLPELPNNTSLGDFTLDDLRRVWAALWLVSAAHVLNEEREDMRTQHNNLLPSAVLFLHRSEWISRLSLASSVPKQCVAAALNLLVFDPTTLHSSIASHPFVRVDRDFLVLCPRLVYHADVRSLVGWLLNAKKSLRDTYAPICDRLQSHWIQRVAEAFRKAGWQCAADRRLSVGIAKIKPDLLCLDRSGHLLVADLKNATVPIEPRQVTDRLKSFEEDRLQVLAYGQFLRDHPELLRKTFGINTPVKVTCAVVHRWPMPIPRPESIGELVTSVPMLLRALDTAQTVDELFTAHSIEGIPVADHVSIEAVNWTFKIPVFRLADDKERLAFFTRHPKRPVT